MLNIIKIISTRRHILKLIYLIIFVYCQTGYAKDLYTIGATHVKSSDNIELNTVNISYISNQREHFWPYLKDDDNVFDWGVNIHKYDGQAEGIDFNANQIEGLFGIQVTDISYVGLKVGRHELDVPDTSSRQSRETYDAYIQLGLKENFIIKINLADDYVYKFGLQPAGVKEFLNAEMSTAGFNWKPFKSIRISYSRSTWVLSDANNRHSTNASILYGISPGWPWIWIGASYEKLEYEQDKPDYWTPNNFHSAGIVFESSFPMNENFNGAISATVTNSKEDSNSQGNGGSINIGLDYSLTKTHTLRFNFNRIISQQEKSEWTENTYNVSFNGSF